MEKRRVAAYARVSTDKDDQANSFESQMQYFTDYINREANWELVKIYADEGLSGTQVKKRPEFLKMIQQCKKGKIDMVLTKSISRFARNTVDCLNYDTMKSESEMMITMMGAFAQAESESISANVKWGHRQSMKNGKVPHQKLPRRHRAGAEHHAAGA